MSFTKSRSIIAVVIVTMLVIASAVFIYWYTGGTQKTVISYSYRIEITPVNSNEFMLRIPVPTYFNGSLSDFVNDLKVVTGTGKHTIEMTKFGYALNVSGSAKVVLFTQGKMNGDRIMFDNLSMQLSLTPSKTENMIYLWTQNNSSVEIGIGVSSTLDGRNIRGNRVITIETQLSVNGWQRITGIYQNTIT